MPGRQPKPLSKEEKQAIHNQLAEDVQAGQSQDNSYRQQAAHEEAEKQEREMLLRRAAPTGGGDQFYGDHSQESIFTSIRRLLTKLAEEMDYSQVVDNGSHRWDPKQLLIGKWNPQRIPEAKKDYATRIDHIYLSLDTSGSVSAYTREIASMAAGAAGLVHLFTGTEGKPTNRVNRKTPLASPHSPFPEWRDQERLYGNSKYQERRQRFTERFFEEWKDLYPTLSGGCFEYWLAWMLELEKPKPGSRLIFWGDTEGVEFHAPRLLAHLVRKYRFAWLLSEGPEDDAHLTYWYHNKLDDPDYILAHADDFTRKEYHKLRLVGLPVIFNVTNAQGIQRAMQELQTRR